MPRDENLETVFQARNIQLATVMKNMLEENGMHASVTNDDVSQSQLVVFQSDAERARALIVDFQERLKLSSKDASSLEELEEKMLSEPMLEWNKDKCLVCKAPRHAICPRCEISSDDFDPAEFEQADGFGGSESPASEDDPVVENDPEELRLMCTVCDQSFKPQYVRHCTGCGHDYGDGVDTAPIDVRTGDASNGRAMLLIGVMAVAGLAGLIWFFVIGQS